MGKATVGRGRSSKPDGEGCPHANAAGFAGGGGGCQRWIRRRLSWHQTAGKASVDSANAKPSPIAKVRVPNFVGSPTSNVQTGSEFLALHIVFVDEKGRESPSLEGIVVGQSPAAGEQVARGALVRLQVETKTVIVSLLAGKTLEQAVAELSKVGLRLGIINWSLLVAESGAATSIPHQICWH